MKKPLLCILVLIGSFNITKGQVTDTINLNIVEVTSTRSNSSAIETPQRIELINSRVIDRIPSTSVDNYLLTLSGINVSRGASIFGSANVTMRGMGNESGRVLVLMDGIPLNKGDGGSVNWNAVSTEISRIEVLKGPGSTTHGGNAMGGIINMVSRKPSKSFEGSISQSAGTFSTYGTRLYLGGLYKRLYWSVNSIYRTSDGYITTPSDEVNAYSIASFLDEYNIGLKTGYSINTKNSIEGGVSFYSGIRGTGSDFTGYNFKNEGLASKKGAYNNYEVISGRITYNGSFNGSDKLQVNGYILRENYTNVKESLKDSVISRYDVLSVRDDAGLLSSYNFKPLKHHKITTGLDVRSSGVDAVDDYVTSTDKVINKGEMLVAGVFVQDNITISNTPFSILAGLRYDMALFNNGMFSVEEPTKETAFLDKFKNEFKSESFNAFSPRFSVNYNKSAKIRIYAGYSRGFRAPVLDDMCRTGKISGGMKIANPNLKPEILDNYEIGSDIAILSNVKFSASLFYSNGVDYHGYISTGDSIKLNNKLRPIMIKSNISKVEIYGLELLLNTKPIKNVELNFAYSHTVTNLLEFKMQNSESDLNLVGCELVYQPKDLFSTTFIWTNRIVNMSTVFSYKGDQWINDVNTEKIDNYYFIDAQLDRTFYNHFEMALTFQNILDNNYVDSRNLIAPGRMVLLKVSYKF